MHAAMKVLARSNRWAGCLSTGFCDNAMNNKKLVAARERLRGVIDSERQQTQKRWAKDALPCYPLLGKCG